MWKQDCLPPQGSTGNSIQPTRQFTARPLVPWRCSVPEAEILPVWVGLLVWVVSFVLVIFVVILVMPVMVLLRV